MTAKRPEPTPDEVLGWLAAHPTRTQADCIDTLWGPLPDPQRRRVEARVRQQVRRARMRQEESAPSAAPARPPPEPPPRAPAIRSEVPAVTTEAAEAAELDLVPFLRQQLAERLSDVALARADGQLRLVPSLDRRVSQIRTQLDRELEREAKVVRLEPTAGAIYGELERRRKAIALRAEILRRNAERRAACDRAS